MSYIWNLKKKSINYLVTRLANAIQVAEHHYPNITMTPKCSILNLSW